MKYDYNTERGLIINALSTEVSELAIAIDEERACNGFTAQYRALSKTYNEASKHYLALIKEVQAEAAAVDPLTDFNKESVYDKRGLLTV